MGQLYHNADAIGVTFGQYYRTEGRAAFARHAFLKRRAHHIGELGGALKILFCLRYGAILMCIFRGGGW